MFLIGLARLGRDAELRFLPDGTPVANLALAFNYGKKGADGKRPTQWCDGALFGERAQKLQQYLVKGQLLEVHLVDPHIETYTARDGTSTPKLTAMVNHIEFAGSAPQQAGQQQAAPAQKAQPTREQARDRQHAASRGASGFDDLEDGPTF